MSDYLLLRMAVGESWRDLASALVGSNKDLSRKAYSVLDRTAEAFLRAGGHWTPEAWLGLSPEERAATVSVGERVAAARAVAQGRATRGGLGEAEVMAQLDGGEALEDMVLEELVQGLK